MKLRFYARGSALVDVPGGHVVGQPPRYVGREFVSGDGKNVGSHPATKEPHEVDSDSDDGRRLAHICRRDGDLLPADDATAQFCGVTKPNAQFANGAWVVKPLEQTKTKEPANG